MELPIPFSVVIPAYNEESRLPKTLDRLARWHPKEFQPVQIILVDDGSQDQTLALARAFAEKDKRVEVVAAPHGGAMHATFAGYRQARHAYIGNMEADCATDPDEFARLLPALDRVDVVIGSRLKRGNLPPIEGKPLVRRFLSRAMSWLFQLFFRCPVIDPQIGFKITTRTVIDQIVPTLRAPVDGIQTSELLVKAYGRGYDVEEVPVLYKHAADSRAVPRNPIGTVVRNFSALIGIWLDAAHAYRKGDLSRQPVRFAFLAALVWKLTRGASWVRR